MTYAEKLKDPRWQKRRLEIMSRDDWKCRWCWTSKVTLVVHHVYYEWERDPWDYPDEALLTLCEICHEGEREARAVERELIVELRHSGLCSSDLRLIVEALRTGRADSSWPSHYKQYALDAGVVILSDWDGAALEFINAYFNGLPFTMRAPSRKAA